MKALAFGLGLALSGQVQADETYILTSISEGRSYGLLVVAPIEGCRAVRYLIRAAAIKSANDAAAALGDHIGGDHVTFAKRMTRTARQLGMDNTTFKNANGLTAEGHLSTARDMNKMGRHLFYDFPQYYHIFSRRTADAGIATVTNTNTPPDNLSSVASYFPTTEQAANSSCTRIHAPIRPATRSDDILLHVTLPAETFITWQTKWAQ